MLTILMRFLEIKEENMPLFHSTLARRMALVTALIFYHIAIYAQPIQKDVPALKDVFANDFYFGCLLSYGHIGFPTDPPVPGQASVVSSTGGDLIKYHMNSMGPGNWMKSTYIVNINGSASAYSASATQKEKDSIDVHPVMVFNGKSLLN
jgi:hypothetical protein